jgi:hypothetical protein
MLSGSLAFAQSNRQGAASGSVVPDTHQELVLASLSGVPVLSLSGDASLPDAPSASKADAAAPAPAASPEPIRKSSSQGAPPAAVGGPFGMEGRVADKKFWGMTTAMFGASVADVELTQRCQEIGTCSYVPKAINTRTAMYGIGIPADVAIMYLSYRMKREHRSMWYLPEALVTAANLYVGMHAYHRLQQ